MAEAVLKFLEEQKELKSLRLENKKLKRTIQQLKEKVLELEKENELDAWAHGWDPQSKKEVYK
jgi:hypothetical protein